MIYYLIVGLIVLFVAMMLLATVSERFIFYYRKTPGRGYIQLSKPGRPKRLVTIHSYMEITGFIGFIATILFVVWLVSN